MVTATCGYRMFMRLCGRKRSGSVRLHARARLDYRCTDR